MTSGNGRDKKGGISMEEGRTVVLKPRWLGKKKYYKKLCLIQKEQLRQKDKKYEDLEAKYFELQDRVSGMVCQYGQHVHIETHGDLQIGDNDVHFVSDNTEIINKLEMLLKRTSDGLTEAVTARAESSLKLEALRDTLTVMFTKLSMIETESSAIKSQVGSTNKQSSDIMNKLDDIKELASIAQNPEPTLEHVADTVLDILNHDSIPGNGPRNLTLDHLSRDARKLPRILAVKYGSKYESVIQRLLLEMTCEEPGTLENKCVGWLARWVRRKRYNNNREEITKSLYRLLKSLEEDVIRAQEKELKQTAVQDRTSVSSRGSSGTITGPQLTHQLRELKDNVVEEVRGLIRSEILDLKTELRELKQRKRLPDETDVKLEELERLSRKLNGNGKQHKNDPLQETLYVPMLL